MPSTPQAPPAPRQVALAFGALLVGVVALALRLAVVPAGLPYLHWWDEPQYTTLASRMAQTGDPNPHFFNYPTLPTYVCAIADRTWLALGRPAGESAPGSAAWSASARDDWNVAETRLARLNRDLTAIVGAVTCALVVPLGAALGLPWAGCAAGVFVAVSPVLVRESAHAAVDPWMALFALAAVLAVASRSPSPRATALAAVLAGMATACKYPGVLALVPALLVAPPRGASWTRRALLLAVLAFAVLALGSPYLVLDARHAAHDVLYELRHYAMRGHPGAEYGRGFGNLAFHWNVFVRALGPIAWLAIPGAVLLARRDAAARRVLLFPVLYLAFMSLQRTAFARNMDVLVPFVALAAAAAAELAARTFARGGARRPAIAAAALACVAGVALEVRALGPLLAGASRPDSRRLAMREVARRFGDAPGAVASELHVHGEDLAAARGPWSVAPASVVLARVRRGEIAWALLPDSTRDDAGVRAATWRAEDGRPIATFGVGALGDGPPIDPRVLVVTPGALARAANAPPAP